MRGIYKVHKYSFDVKSIAGESTSIRTKFIFHITPWVPLFAHCVPKVGKAMGILYILVKLTDRLYRKRNKERVG